MWVGLRTLRVAFHLELVNNKHDGALTMSRVDVPFTGAIRVVLVGVVRRLNVASNVRYVCYTLCTTSTPPPIN